MNEHEDMSDLAREWDMRRKRREERKTRIIGAMILTFLGLVLIFVGIFVSWSLTALGMIFGTAGFWNTRRLDKIALQEQDEDVLAAKELQLKLYGDRSSPR